jgi:hypothetical protein
LLALQEKDAEAARKIESRNRRRAAVRLANMDMSPKPTTIPDTTMITLTMLVDPPPLYDMVPPPTWYDPATAMAIHFQKELLGMESQQQKYRKPPRFLNARSSLEMYKNWENIFLKRQLSTDEDYEYASLASSLFQKESGGGDSDSDSGSGSGSDDDDGGEESGSGSDEDGDKDKVEEEEENKENSGADLNKAYEESMDGGSDTNERVESDDGTGLIEQVEMSSGNVVDESIDQTADEKAPDEENTDTQESKSDDIASDDKADETVEEGGKDEAKVDQEDEDKGEDDKKTPRDEANEDNKSEDKSEEKEEGGVGEGEEDKSTGDQTNKEGSDHGSETSSTSGSKSKRSKRKKKKEEGSANNSVASDDEASQDGSSIVSSSTTTSKKKKKKKNKGTSAAPLAQYQLKAIGKQLWANYKDKHAGAAVFIKDIFDDTNRKRFENTLLDEISTCACIPQKFFTIEEVRKLPPNDDLLKKFKKQKEDFFLEEDRLAEQKRVEAEELMQANLDLVAKISEMALHKREEEATQALLDDQSVGSDGKSKMSLGSLLSRGVSGEVKGEDIDSGSGNQSADGTVNDGTQSGGGGAGGVDNSSSLEEKSSDMTSGKTAEQQEQEEEESFLASIETEEERKRKVRLATRKQSAWGKAQHDAMELTSALVTAEEVRDRARDTDQNEASVVSQPGSGLHCDPRVTGSAPGSVVGSAPGSALNVGTPGGSVDVSHFHDPRFPRRIGEFVGVEGTTPLSPRQLCITISNPENDRHDPNHWMARQMREETAYEKQLRRIEFLKVLQLKGTTRVQVLREKIKIVKQKQQELNEIAETYLGPTLKVVKKVVKPMSLHIQKKTLQCAKEIGKEIRRRREMSRLEKGAEDDDAIVMVRKSSTPPGAGAGAGAGAVPDEQEDTTHDQQEVATAVPESGVVPSGGVMTDTEIDREANAHAVNIVTAAESAAAIAQENINSDEENKHREMISNIRDQLAKEEEELLSDLETNSTREEREQADKEEREEKEKKRVLAASASSLVLSADSQSIANEGSDLPPPLPLPSSSGSFQNNESLSDSPSLDASSTPAPPKVDSDEHEVMKVLNVMCHTVMERIDDRYDVYDEYLDLWDRQETPDRESDLIGCQVSLMVHVDDSLKQNMYLYDLQSQDLAVMLYNQLWDRTSPLNTSSMTKHIVGIQHKSAFSKRQFKEWEHLWVHILSPTYFRYCTKPSKKERFIAHREEGRLKSGVLLINPTDSFDENQKAVFMGLVQPKSKFEIDDPNAAATLNFDVDDIGAELFDENGTAKLSIYRPNLNEITKREVEKCKRIYRGFLDKYNAEMTFGLARGGLRANQYSALKDLDTSKRVYEIAKQKLARDLRLESEGPSFVPQITKITGEQFGEWMREAKEEEADELKEKKLKKLQQRELRKQEAEMRKRYTQQKHWM